MGLDKKEAVSERPTMGLVGDEFPSTSRSTRKASSSNKEESKDVIALIVRRFKKFLHHNKDIVEGNSRK